MGDVVLKKEKKKKTRRGEVSVSTASPRSSTASTMEIRSKKAPMRLQRPEGRHCALSHSANYAFVVGTVPYSSSKMRADLLRCLEWVRRIRSINVKVPIFLIHFYHICASVICFNLVVTFFYFSLGLPKYNFLNSGAVVYENLVKSRHRKIRMFLQH